MGFTLEDYLGSRSPFVDRSRNDGGDSLVEIPPPSGNWSTYGGTAVPRNPISSSPTPSSSGSGNSFADDPSGEGGDVPPDHGYPLPPPSPPGAPAPTPPSNGFNPTYELPYTGKASRQLIEAMYPGYTLRDGKIVWIGSGAPNSQLDASRTTEYLNSLGDPLAAGKYQDFFKTLYNGVTAKQEFLSDQNSLGKILRAAGFNVTGPNTTGGISKVQLPGQSGMNGWVRVIEGDPQKGGSWTWVNQPVGATGTPGLENGEFTDPWGSELESAVAAYLKKLGIDPNRPGLQSLMDRLLKADVDNQKNVKDFVSRLSTRRDELNAPPFSEGDEAVLRAKAFDQLERRRQETLKNRRNEIYARGFEPTSGIAEGSDQETNRQFEGVRGGIESDLLQAMMQETQNRRDKATSLDGLIAQALAGGDLASLQFLAQNSDIESTLIQDALNRGRESIAAIGIPLDLMSQRQQLANQTLGLGGNPQSIMQSILGILSFANQNRQTNMMGNMNNMAGLGQLMSILFPRGA